MTSHVVEWNTTERVTHDSVNSSVSLRCCKRIHTETMSSRRQTDVACTRGQRPLPFRFCKNPWTMRSVNPISSTACPTMRLLVSPKWWDSSITKTCPVPGVYLYWIITYLLWHWEMETLYRPRWCSVRIQSINWACSHYTDSLNIFIRYVDNFADHSDSLCSFTFIYSLLAFYSLCSFMFHLFITSISFKCLPSFIHYFYFIPCVLLPSFIHHFYFIHMCSFASFIHYFYFIHMCFIFHLFITKNIMAARKTCPEQLTINPKFYQCCKGIYS